METHPSINHRSLSGSEEDDEEGSDSGSEREESGSELEDDGLAGAAGFTDENQAWLKPKAMKGGKQQLLSSDDEGDEGASSDEDEDEEDEVDDDDEFGQLPLGAEGSEEEEEEEGSEGAFDEEEDDEDEFEAKEYEGEEGEEGKDDKGRALGLPEDMKERIEEVVETLSDFRARRKPGGEFGLHIVLDRSKRETAFSFFTSTFPFPSLAPRSEYTRRLARDLSEHYGYLPELTDMFLSMFSPAGQSSRHCGHISASFIAHHGD